MSNQKHYHYQFVDPNLLDHQDVLLWPLIQQQQYKLQLILNILHKHSIVLYLSQDILVQSN